ncbi:MAG TPA: hypothetical protein VEV63_09685 [Streptosporangiaceae bacterium]|nr:hypothetical protein [Streptosporangiaceae bacterium]
MYVVLLLAAGAILGGVIVVAMGRGGEMVMFMRDLPVALHRPRTPGEVATQRLPLGPIGYQVQATEEALFAAANLLAERDHEIATLRSEIWLLRGRDHAPAPDRPLERDDQEEDAADAATQGGLAGSEQSRQ